MTEAVSGIVLADDATGALECASLLAGAGIKVSIDLRNEPSSEDPPAGVVVVDTESRHLSPAAAGERIRRWAAYIEEHGVSRIFKKTDSTLRGNIGSELEALHASSRCSQLVYIPAYPSLGRTVVDGQLCVHGRPVDQTEFASDVRQPVKSSDLARLFSLETRSNVFNVRSPPDLADRLRTREKRILICDAATESDLGELAGVLRNSPQAPIVAGPAGFIRYWAAMNPFPEQPPPPAPRIQDWLVLCGSLHPVSRRQANLAGISGVPVLSTAPDQSPSSESVAAELAHRAIGYVREHYPKGILIMGGDTACAFWQALELRALSALPEILPGVAACFSPDAGLLFVTKAGGFGEDSLVKQVMDRFQ